MAWRSYKHYLIELYSNVVKKDTIEFEVEVYDKRDEDGLTIWSFPTLEEAVEMYNNIKG